MFLVIYTVNLCIFLYLWLVPHPTVFVTHLWLYIKLMYICMRIYGCFPKICGGLVTHVYIVPDLRMSEVRLPVFHARSCRGFNL